MAHNCFKVPAKPKSKTNMFKVDFADSALQETQVTSDDGIDSARLL
jgi:hypothetical protein